MECIDLIEYVFVRNETMRICSHCALYISISQPKTRVYTNTNIRTVAITIKIISYLTVTRFSISIKILQTIIDNIVEHTIQTQGASKFHYSYYTNPITYDSVLSIQSHFVWRKSYKSGHACSPIHCDSFKLGFLFSCFINSILITSKHFMYSYAKCWCTPSIKPN